MDITLQSKIIFGVSSQIQPACVLLNKYTIDRCFMRVAVTLKDVCVTHITHPLTKQTTRTSVGHWVMYKTYCDGIHIYFCHHQEHSPKPTTRGCNQHIRLHHRQWPRSDAYVDSRHGVTMHDHRDTTRKCWLRKSCHTDDWWWVIGRPHPKLLVQGGSMIQSWWPSASSNTSCLLM